ncbi:MAG TPA: carboxypeptidase regulatory-like domain-containing protein [Vicinamibacterales bacterium]|nr:carboxypeptidase regulatory-like domain-containing protein [Vicinamibacterales bacterium]
MQVIRAAALTRCLGLAAAIVCGTVAAAAAQGTTGSISGVVTDESKAALPGATVTVKDSETGQSRVLTSDGQGRYRADGLAPGKYVVTVELSGFRTAEYPAMNISIGQTATLNIQMQIGGVSEKVVVMADAALAATRQSSVTALVDQTQIRELPLNGRDFSQLTLLQLGVTSSPSTSQTVDRGMGTQVSVAGARPNQISFQVDGADVNTQGNGAPGSAAGGMLGVDTVREFQVLVNNYSAEYGRSTGGIVVAVTRSGTNNLSGSAFEFGRNSKFDSRTYFDDPTQPIPPLKRNQFGGTLGGPILHDKTFFFGSYEGLRQTLGLTTIANVPSDATRARADLSAATAPYLLLYPKANGTVNGASAQYIQQVVNPTHENLAVGKVDHNFSSAHSISIKYSFDKAQVDQPGFIPFWTANTRTKSQSTVGEYKWVISPTLLNSAKVAYNQAYEATASLETQSFSPNLFFIPSTRFGTINVNGLNSLGPDTQSPTFVNLKSLQAIDNLAWTRGSHSLKTGLSYTHYMNDQDSSFDFGGLYTFTSIDNFVLNKPGTFEGQAPGSTTARRWRQDLIGLYGQDDWSATRNLTINLGVRYEFITEPHELDGRSSALPDLQSTNFVTGGDIFKNPSLKNVAPRAGFAWNITGDGRNVVHGGGGMFYEPILSNIYRAYGDRTPPFYNSINPSNPPFPAAPVNGTAPPLRLDLVNYNLKNPYRVQYNVSFQRELWGHTTATVGYIGARGYNQIRNIEYNQAIPTINPDGTLFFPAGGTRRNPNFASMRLRTTDGRSWYNGFVAGANRRFTNGLSVQGSYTLGKSVDEGSQAVGSGDFNNSFQPPYGAIPLLNKGLSDFDIRHNFSANATWALPFGQSASGVARAFAAGWQVSGIFTAHTGIPITPVLGFDRARALPRSGGAGQWPDLVSGCSSNPVNGAPNAWFDVTCFALPAVGTIGNLGRNTVRAPGYAALDAAVFKNVPLGGTRRLQLRLEGFNITNRANFGLPSTTVFSSSGLVSTAGQITSIVGTARQFQFGAKITF